MAAVLLMPISGSAGERIDPVWDHLIKLRVEAVQPFDWVTQEEAFTVIVMRRDEESHTQRLMAVTTGSGRKMMEVTVEGAHFSSVEVTSLKDFSHDILVTIWDCGVHSKALRLYEVTTGRLLGLWYNESTIEWELRGNHLVLKFYPNLQAPGDEPEFREELWPRTAEKPMTKGGK